MKVVRVLDQAGWHVAKALRVPDNITLLHLTPYNPEMNPVECIWAYLKSHYLSHWAFRDYDDLLVPSREAWNSLSDECLRSICQTDWVTHEVEL